MRLVDSILMEIDQEAKTTKRVLERIPEDKLSWKPHPKAFSLGQLALHIASVPGSVAAAAAPDTMEAPAFSQPEPKSRQEVLDTFSKSLASAKDTLNKMDDARLLSTWSLTKNGKVLMSIPRFGFIRAILMNHNYHHRGQLSTYLRILDVAVPSIYGPSADENPFA
ncbi:MAG TPA: DinB family protein [Candidatus Cybelea sp.]|nr:DinB family protein [Candidatus Cybelea sp.]